MLIMDWGSVRRFLRVCCSLRPRDIALVCVAGKSREVHDECVSVFVHYHPVIDSLGRLLEPPLSACARLCANQTVRGGARVAPNTTAHTSKHTQTLALRTVALIVASVIIMFCSYGTKVFLRM